MLLNETDAPASSKFSDPKQTLAGDPRAFVELQQLKTLWFNTGTQCNLACENCYIESSPKNDRLAFLSAQDIAPYLEEIRKNPQPTELIGLTGGEPFLNPHITEIVDLILDQNLSCLILSNGHRLLHRHKESLLHWKEQHGQRLQLRISLDHYRADEHERQRGPRTFESAMKSLAWLAENGFSLSVAGRSTLGEEPSLALRGYQELFDSRQIQLRTEKMEDFVLFPEMASKKDVPEITTACWDILSKRPEDQMCASERMIVRRKGEASPVVLPCTLLAYDRQFELGNSLSEADTKVYLNHRFCAEFCVLGGASCSSTAQ